MKKTILIADDEKNMIWALKKALSKEGYNIISASNGVEALELFSKNVPSLVLLDLKMPKLNGIEALKEMKKSNPEIPVIMLTAHGSAKTAVEAMKIGALDYLSKPFDIEELKIIINKAIDYKNLTDEVSYLKEKLRETDTKIVYESDEMNELLKTSLRVAPTKANVLILGESGTGKELIANFIHKNSERSEGELVKINCGALPENLLESELFGYEKGAFTGATKRKLGKFDRADKGTIFLDEIGEISLTMQVKLLRVLQEREFERIGGNETITVDTRVIAATNKDLKKMVEENKFREDLFYRLNVIPIEVPPLRDRRDDIPILVKHFIRKYSCQMGRLNMSIENDALERLKRYNWKGNIRELENVIERCVILSNSEKIQLESLPQEIKNEVTSGSHKFQLPSKGIKLEEVVKNMIIQALERTDYNQTKAAKLLGITRYTLLYRMDKYNISK
ncbi:MAG: sigma-54-dependent Fis family transcriptional regulator [Firmicutes bacterium]|nr:sigma-54-dependent Fis family transcriptional regulator [Bacillota bacterium]